MKTKLLASLLGLAVGGCALRPVPPTAEEATVERHISAPASAVAAAIRKVAIARGFMEARPNVYERAASYPTDPILGLVKTSDEPNAYLRIAVALRENRTGTLVTAVPSTYSPGSQYGPFYWRPGTKANAETVALLDAALAENAFASEETAR